LSLVKGFRLKRISNL